MKNFVILISLLLPNLAEAATQATQKQLTLDKVKHPLLAKKGKSRSKKRGLRKKILSQEARSKKGQRTKIDFDEASIDGRRRDPAGVAITKNRPDHAYDLINLRLRWHPEMVQSTRNLETGRGK